MKPIIWGLRGVVIHGHARGGSQLGFPTANIRLTADVMQQLKPMENGVYFGWACIEPNVDKTYPMVMSVGFNPHFKDVELTAEVHFIHKFHSDFYGEKIRVAALGKLRDQKSFNSLEELIHEIREDVRRGVSLLQNTSGTEWITKVTPSDPTGATEEDTYFVCPLLSSSY